MVERAFGWHARYWGRMATNRALTLAANATPLELGHAYATAGDRMHVPEELDGAFGHLLAVYVLAQAAGG
jgi:hypothetical protein